MKQKCKYLKTCPSAYEFELCKTHPTKCTIFMKRSLLDRVKETHMPIKEEELFIGAITYVPLGMRRFVGGEIKTRFRR